jgi:putative pyruvate formate lyase activating enzyme
MKAETAGLLKNCRVCPRDCGVNRLGDERGVCQSGESIKVARAALHMWEEPCISGGRGSGTVFFAYCNLRCAFCQNHSISQEDQAGVDLTIDELARVFLRVQGMGADNLNLVTPTHYLPQVREALIEARESGLSIPVVYNSGGYESVSHLRELEGLVDVYLPDMKFFSPDLSARMARARDYFAVASGAVVEMYRQVGSPEFDERGLITRGLIVRHLVLPGHTDDSKEILKWIRHNLPKSVYVSLMGQYFPTHHAGEFPELARRLTAEEYDEVLEFFSAIGLENGYMQELSSAKEEYVPDWDLSGLED